MRHNQLAPHHHQIIHPDPCPVPPAPTFIPSFARRVGAQLPRPFQEQPDRIALFHATRAAGHAFAVEEGEGQDEIGLLDALLHLRVLLAERLFELRLAEERGLGHGFGLEGDGRVGFEAAFLGE